jgi:hypothetical protein
MARMLYAGDRSRCLKYCQQRLELRVLHRCTDDAFRCASCAVTLRQVHVVRFAPVGGGCRAPADMAPNHLSQGMFPDDLQTLCKDKHVPRPTGRSTVGSRVDCHESERAQATHRRGSCRTCCALMVLDISQVEVAKRAERQFHAVAPLHPTAPGIGWSPVVHLEPANHENIRWNLLLKTMKQLVLCHRQGGSTTTTPAIVPLTGQCYNSKHALHSCTWQACLHQQTSPTSKSL